MTSGGLSPFPAARFTPSEEFPSSIAVPHHCGLCPLAVVSPARPSVHRSDLSTLLACQQAAVNPLHLPQPKPLKRSLLPSSVPFTFALLGPKPPLCSCELHPDSLGGSGMRSLLLTIPFRAGPPRCVCLAPEGVLAGRLTLVARCRSTEDRV